jgi:diguanylate cyclase (GGDEF)-like protein
LTERWERLAEQDPLTGLNNRRALETWLETCMRDPRLPFSLLLLDLDGFKAINDRFGHAIGDRVLVDIGRLLRAGCRVQDIPVRFGGDEFVVALPGADEVEAYAIAERMREGIAAHKWDMVAPGLAATTSVGCACSSEGADANAVFAQADRRLYQAKRSGRNQVCMAGP